MRVQIADIENWVKLLELLPEKKSSARNSCDSACRNIRRGRNAEVARRTSIVDTWICEDEFVYNESIGERKSGTFVSFLFRVPTVSSIYRVHIRRTAYTLALRVPGASVLRVIERAKRGVNGRAREK